MADRDVVDIFTTALDHLDISPAAKAVLINIRSELTEAYQRSFVEMVQAIQRQASALERLQTSLNILIEKLAPEIKGQLPVALRAAGPSEQADLATALVTADPFAAGYTLTQVHLAAVLGVSQGDVSVLVRAFKLTDDGDCAVVVRKGKRTNWVNYHPRAIEKFRESVAKPPSGLTASQRGALARVTKRLVLSQKPTS